MKNQSAQKLIHYSQIPNAALQKKNVRWLIDIPSCPHVWQTSKITQSTQPSLPKGSWQVFLGPQMMRTPMKIYVFVGQMSQKRYLGGKPQLLLQLKSRLLQPHEIPWNSNPLLEILMCFELQFFSQALHTEGPRRPSYRRTKTPSRGSTVRLGCARKLRSYDISGWNKPFNLDILRETFAAKAICFLGVSEKHHKILNEIVVLCSPNHSLFLFLF